MQRNATLRSFRIEACMLRKPRAERHFVGDENVGAGTFDGAANDIPGQSGRLQSFGPLYIHDAGSCHDEAVNITQARLLGRAKVLDQEVDERAHTRGLIAAAWIVDKQVRGRQQEVRQHDFQPAAFQVFREIPF
jgi:hypothetical protein